MVSVELLDMTLFSTLGFSIVALAMVLLNMRSNRTFKKGAIDWMNDLHVRLEKIELNKALAQSVEDKETEDLEKEIESKKQRLKELKSKE